MKRKSGEFDDVVIAGFLHDMNTEPSRLVIEGLELAECDLSELVGFIVANYRDIKRLSGNPKMSLKLENDKRSVSF